MIAMTEQYNRYKTMIELALKSWFENQADGADGLREAMSYSLLVGGKRVRPVLTLAFCELCGGDVYAALPVACGVEMLHTYSLIHDDLPCMDDDDERRGMPTNHKKFGETTAVLAGDCLQGEAFSAICAADIGVEERFRCCRILGRAAGLMGICGGQYLDLSDCPADGDILRRTHERKTASLIGAACAMGAAAAGGEDSVISAAEAFGTALGMAFQCRDDILDGDGFCALLGVEKCQELTDRYTNRALELLDTFENTEFLKKLTLSLAGRSN